MRLSKTKNQKKKYKALILDLDGTLTPNRRDGMPSKKVREAIADYVAPSVENDGVADVIEKFVLRKD